ncbi:MAG TPA: hypothetical protein PLC88_10475, partial [Syntrophomonas sp.]|nr:hypothetical protein [Syntrophomonas sp.]
MSSSNIYRQYDIRGIVGQELTDEVMFNIGRAFALYARQHGYRKILLGRDNRISSPHYRDLLTEALLQSGCEVTDLGMVITPMFYYASRHLEIGAGIMITASHNPPEYNGIKFIPEYAGPALPEVTSAIEEEVNRILNGGKVYEIDLEEALPLDLLIDIELDKEYGTHLLRMINPDFIKEKPMRIVADPMYGAGIGYLDRILAELGVEVKTIN